MIGFLSTLSKIRTLPKHKNIMFVQMFWPIQYPFFYFFFVNIMLLEVYHNILLKMFHNLDPCTLCKQVLPAKVSDQHANNERTDETSDSKDRHSERVHDS